MRKRRRSRAGLPGLDSLANHGSSLIMHNVKSATGEGARAPRNEAQFTLPAGIDPEVFLSRPKCLEIFANNPLATSGDYPEGRLTSRI